MTTINRAFCTIYCCAAIVWLLAFFQEDIHGHGDGLAAGPGAAGGTIGIRHAQERPAIIPATIRRPAATPLTDPSSGAAMPTLRADVRAEPSAMTHKAPPKSAAAEKEGETTAPKACALSLPPHSQPFENRVSGTAPAAPEPHIPWVEAFLEKLGPARYDMLPARNPGYTSLPELRPELEDTPIDLPVGFGKGRVMLTYSTKF